MKIIKVGDNYVGMNPSPVHRLNWAVGIVLWIVSVVIGSNLLEWVRR